MRLSFLSLTLAFFLSGCATQSFDRFSPVSDQRCDVLITELDARIVRQQLRLPGTQLIQGRPFLRLDRFAASFSQSTLTPEQQEAWQQYSFQLGKREFLSEASLIVAESQLNQVSACIDEAYDTWRADNGWVSVADTLSVPSEYRALNRVLGLYPLTTLPMNIAISGYRNDMTARMASSQTFDRVNRYQASTNKQPVTVKVDALGVLELPDSEWQALFDQHAPYLEIEAQTQDDEIGRIELDDDRVAVNTKRPTYYTYVSYSRFHDETLIHLNYAFWFPARTALRAIDIYAGEFDGITWRVTLDKTGQIKWFDSIHSCGCYHKLYSPGGVWVLNDDIRGEKPILVEVDSALQTQTPLLRITSAEHYIISVEPADSLNSATLVQREPYERLINIGSAQAGKTFFDRRGLVADSKRAERFLLWPQGIISAGAMRIRGTHAIAFIGQRHFDDAFLFEELLEAAGDTN